MEGFSLLNLAGLPSPAGSSVAKFVSLPTAATASNVVALLFIGSDGGWIGRLALVATNPEISGLLLALGFLGLLIELQTLHGIAAAIGALALGLFFGTHVFAGYADPAVVAFGVAGFLAILFELHVLPGHGFAGIFGVCALLISTVVAFGSTNLATALQALAIAILLSVAGVAMFTRFYGRNAFLSRLAFAGVQGPDFVAGNYYGELIGRAGFAVSYLRPSGVAAIDGKRIDVLTEGEFISAGSAICVTRAEGARVFVKPL